MSVISVEHLSKSFPNFWGKKKTVLDSISFQVSENKVTALMGSNGSGKTTTLKCLLRLIHPDHGKILFWESNSFSKEVRKQIGFLPERLSFYDFLSAAEVIQYYCALCNQVCSANSIRSAMERVGLQDVSRQSVKTFSKGMLQRLGFAILFLRNPKLLILDEPMSGLDPSGRDLVVELIKSFQKGGASILLTSHQIEGVKDFCDDLLVIERGQMDFAGSFRDYEKTIKIKNEKVLELDVHE